MNNIDIKNDIENIQSEINHTFKSIEDFRANATEDDYNKLENYILSQ